MVKKQCVDCPKILKNVHGRTKRCDGCEKLWRREYTRLYMAKRNLRKRWEVKETRTQSDILLLSDDHMTGLGTFVLTKYRHGDIKKEYQDIQKLKQLAGI